MAEIFIRVQNVELCALGRKNVFDVINNGREGEIAGDQDQDHDRHWKKERFVKIVLEKLLNKYCCESWMSLQNILFLNLIIILG